MVVTLLPRVALDNLVQVENALIPILDTLLPRVALDNLRQK